MFLARESKTGLGSRLLAQHHMPTQGRSMAPVVGVIAFYGRLRLLPKQFLFLTNVELGDSTWDRFELRDNKAKKTGVSDVLGPPIEDGEALCCWQNTTCPRKRGAWHPSSRSMAPVVEVFAFYGRLRLLPKQFLFLTNVELGDSTWDRFELTDNKAKKTGVSDVLGLPIEDGRGTSSLRAVLTGKCQR